MTILLALATFGLMFSICVHFLLAEQRSIEKRKDAEPVPAF